MVLSSRAINGVATRAEGSLAHCGSGSGGFELTYSCQGPACSSLDHSLQNVVCHKDGSSTLICSNDFRCRPGTSTYQSNFTFSQNEPDPWNPMMENKPDVWVAQNQHVMVGSCARFSLISDGTKGGSHLNDAENTCPNAQSLSTPGALAGHVSTSAGRPHVGATQRPHIFEDTGSRRNVSGSSLLLAFLVAILLLPRAEALNNRFLRDTSGHVSRATSGEVQTFAEQFKFGLTEKASNQGVDGEAFAADLVSNVISTVCQRHFDGSSPRAFEPEILNNCVASLYYGEHLPQPALRFLAVFGGSLLCNYIVSKSYPSGGNFLPDSCDRLQSLMHGKELDTSSAAASMSITDGSSVTRGEPSGLMLTTASSNTGALDNSISTPPPEGLASIETSPAETSRSRIGTGVALPTSTSKSSHLSIASSLVDDGRLPVHSSKASTSAALARPDLSVSITAAAFQLQRSGTSEPPGFHPKWTSQTASRASSTPSIDLSHTVSRPHRPVELSESIPPAYKIAPPSLFQPTRAPSSAAYSSKSVGDTSMGPSLSGSVQTISPSTASFIPGEVVSIDSSATRPATNSKLTTPDVSSESKQTTSVIEASSSTRLESSLSVSGQNALPATGQDDTTVFSGSGQAIPSRLTSGILSGASMSYIPSHSDVSMSLSSEQSQAVDPSVPTYTQGQVTAQSVPDYVATASQQMIPVSTLSSMSMWKPSSTSEPDWLSSKSSKVDIARPSVQPISSSIRTNSRVAQTLIAVPSNVEFADDRRTGDMTSNAPLPTIWSSAAVGDSTGVQTGTDSVTGSTITALGSKIRLAESLASPQVTSTEGKLGTATLLDIVSSHRPVLDQLASYTPVDHTINTQAVNDPNPTLSGPEALENANVHNTVSAMAASVISRFITASTAAASLAPVAASESNLVTLPPAYNLRPIATTKPSRLYGESVLPVTSVSELRLASLPPTENSTIEVFNGSLVMSASPATSTSAIDTRILDLSAGWSSSASVVLLTRPPDSKIPSVQGEPMALVVSATSAFAPGSLAFGRLSSSSAGFPTTSRSPSALVPGPPVANMSIPLGIFGSGNFVPSSSRSTAPASRTSHSLPSVTAALTSSGGSNTPVVSESAPTVESLPITPPTAVTHSTSNLSDTPLDASSSPDLTTLCAQFALTPVFCPDIGCVSLMTNKAHCGACGQVCEHDCYQGSCVCPDLTTPDEQSGCGNKHVAIDCETGYYTRDGNGFKVCAPAEWPSISNAPSLTWDRSIVASSIVSVNPLPPQKSPLLSALVTSVEIPDFDFAGCPLILPDVCDDVCFNTRSEQNHCGGCDNFCSGICVAGTCLAISTGATPQLASTRRVVATGDLLITAQARPTLTATAQPVVAYIWRGLAGAQQQV